MTPEERALRSRFKYYLNRIIPPVSPASWVDRRGYVRVYVAKGKWVYEHRLVMERKLGRRLASSEAVHHLNGVRADNRPANLELMPVGEHIAHHNRSQPKRRRSLESTSTATALATAPDGSEPQL